MKKLFIAFLFLAFQFSNAQSLTTLITKNNVQIPIDRKVISGKIRMEINTILFTGAYIKVEGNYYYIDSDNIKIVLSPINLYKPKQAIIDAETFLDSILMGKNIYEIIAQRLTQMSLLQIQSEAGENYGTVANDWELYAE